MANGQQRIPHDLILVGGSARFVRGAWRYLTRTVGFERQLPPGGTGWLEEARSSGLESDDGKLRLLWFQEASGFFQAKQQGRSRIIIVDIDDLVSGSQGIAEQELRELQNQLDAKDHVFFLSATHVDRTSFRTAPDAEGETQEVELGKVLPRSRDSLRLVHGAIETLHTQGRVTKESEAPSDAIHLLVTGAGFEFRSSLHSIGQPRTERLLRNSLAKSGDENSADYPLPKLEEILEGTAASSDEVTRRFHRGLEQAVAHRDLDAYWDRLFEIVSIDAVLRAGRDHLSDHRDRDKLEAMAKEANYRREFRAALLRHDWGLPKHILRAAELPFDAWLTTNYTHFSDRAVIEAQRDQARDQATDKRKPPWRAVANSAEALRVAADNQGLLQKKDRIVFKLHGDIGDINTMAIAGHDKDPASPLHFKVEALQHLYQSAENYLRLMLTEARQPGEPPPDKPLPEKVIWHIVGHGLFDRQLCRLIRNVVSGATRLKHEIRMIAPEPGPKAESAANLLRAFDPDIEALLEGNIVSYRPQGEENGARTRPLAEVCGSSLSSKSPSPKTSPSSKTSPSFKLVAIRATAAVYLESLFSASNLADELPRLERGFAFTR